MRRVLARRDMRLYVAGQTLSLFGDTVLWLALGVWAKMLTGSSAAAGMVIFCLTAPSLLSPLSGRPQLRAPSARSPRWQPASVICGAPSRCAR